MVSTDFVYLKRRAISNPQGPEALRLQWLQARAIGSPFSQLLNLVGRHLDGGFSIPEIDAYITGVLLDAQQRLKEIHQSGMMFPRRLHFAEKTIESAADARRRGSKVSKRVLLQALAIAAEVEAHDRPH